MPLPRLQLLELEDLHWFPRILRNYATDFLRLLQLVLSIHRPVVPLIKVLMQQTDTHQIVDLCSGACGPMKQVVRGLSEHGMPVRVLLTDKYPNLTAFQHVSTDSDGAIGFETAPVDARDVPEQLVGLRTLFNGFHHFPPSEARAILKNAVAARQPIAIFELSERTAHGLLQMLLVPLMVFLLTPLLRPFDWRRLALTYLLPLVPLTCFWDGLVSQLRAFTTSELLQLAQEVPNDNYTWQCGKLKVDRMPVRVTYLTGSPVALSG